MRWALIKNGAYDGITNMSIDKSLLDHVKKTHVPVMRFYQWKPSAISLGLYESPRDVDGDFCRKNNIDVVRRPTGGKAVYHDEKDFTYSVAAPISIFQNDVKMAYKTICGWLINALDDLGIKASLANTNDILVQGKKISGNAAKVENGIVLQHGTLIYEPHKKMMADIFKVNEEKVERKVTSILENKKISRDDVHAALLKNFTKGKAWGEIKVPQETRQTLPSKSKFVARGNCYTDW